MIETGPNELKQNILVFFYLKIKNNKNNFFEFIDNFQKKCEQ